MTTRAGLSRIVGTAGGSALALALLVCGCVFAALAGPRSACTRVPRRCTRP
jgi:hypothetical protein